jgi:hypothetical protein
MDDRVLVYRGADQPDMSVINPESDVWQHIKVGGHCADVCEWNRCVGAHRSDSKRVHRDQLADPIRLHLV